MTKEEIIELTSDTEFKKKYPLISVVCKYKVNNSASSSIEYFFTKNSNNDYVLGNLSVYERLSLLEEMIGTSDVEYKIG